MIVSECSFMDVSADSGFILKIIFIFFNAIIIVENKRQFELTTFYSTL